MITRHSGWYRRCISPPHASVQFSPATIERISTGVDILARSRSGTGRMSGLIRVRGIYVSGRSTWKGTLEFHFPLSGVLAGSEAISPILGRSGVILWLLPIWRGKVGGVRSAGY